jgi:hypothetical protein
MTEAVPWHATEFFRSLWNRAFMKRGAGAGGEKQPQVPFGKLRARFRLGRRGGLRS